MGLLTFLRNRLEVRNETPSAAVAKGRLQVLIAHERTNRDGPEYLPQLKQDIVDVIKRYVNVGEEHVLVKLDTQDNRDVLELNITLPDVSADETADQAEATPSESNETTSTHKTSAVEKAADIESETNNGKSPPRQPARQSNKGKNGQKKRKNKR